MSRKSRPDRQSLQSELARARPVGAFSWPIDAQPCPADEAKAQAAQSVANRVWATRQAEHWRASDEILIAEHATVSVDLTDLQGVLDREGYVTAEGKAHPLVAVVDGLSRRRLALARALALTGSPIDPRTLASARPARQQTVSIEAKKVNTEAPGNSILSRLIQ